MPNSITISATELKNNTAEVINSVYFGEDPVIIERHGKPVVKMVPIKESTNSEKELQKKLDRYFGSAPDFPDSKNTYHRKKDLEI